MKNCVLLLSTLFFLECLLHGFERVCGRGYLQSVDFKLGESFFYGRNDTIPPPLPIAKFDSEIGWIRDFEEAHSEKNIVAVFGDSWTYGLGVTPNEAFPKVMERKLKDTQVINYGVPGYGIDQMFVLAERMVSKIKPKAVVLAFISADLHRSCFPFYFGKQKIFLGEGSALERDKLKSPETLLLEHRGFKRRFLDGWIVWGFKSRLIRLLGEVALKVPIEQCVRDLNVEILKRAKRIHPNVHLVHLGEDLPFGFESQMRNTGIPFTSLVNDLKEGRDAGRFILDESQKHPGPQYHAAIADLLINEFEQGYGFTFRM